MSATHPSPPPEFLFNAFPFSLAKIGWRMILITQNLPPSSLSTDAEGAWIIGKEKEREREICEKEREREKKKKKGYLKSWIL